MWYRLRDVSLPLEGYRDVEQTLREGLSLSSLMCQLACLGAGTAIVVLIPWSGAIAAYRPDDVSPR